MKRIGMVLALSLLGCGGVRNDDDLDFMAEAREAGDHGSGPTSVTHAKGMAGLFVLEDPTIDPSMSASQNADRVAMQASSSTVSCATAKLTHTSGSATVSVDFGTGCTLPEIGTVSGAVSVTVSKSGSTVTVAFTFSNLTVNGMALSGTLSASTSNGTSFMIVIDLTGSKHVTFTGTIATDAGGKGVTVDGSGMSGDASYTIAGLHHQFGGCYADAGTLTLSSTTRTLTGKMVTVVKSMKFDAATPSTGKVTVTLSGKSYSTTLPPYGSCPK